MEKLIFFLGSIYIVIGTIFLLVPLIYLELGRAKDFIRAFLNLLIGLILIIKNKTIDEAFFFILIFFTILVVFYLMEVFSSRWNQLIDKEKNKLTTFVEFKNNLSKMLEAFNLGVISFRKPMKNLDFNKNNQKKSPKKWVRNDKNDNIKV